MKEILKFEKGFAKGSKASDSPPLFPLYSPYPEKWAVYKIPKRCLRIALGLAEAPIRPPKPPPTLLSIECPVFYPGHLRKSI